MPTQQQSAVDRVIEKAFEELREVFGWERIEVSAMFWQHRSDRTGDFNSCGGWIVARGRKIYAGFSLEDAVRACIKDHAQGKESCIPHLANGR